MNHDLVVKNDGKVPVKPFPEAGIEKLLSLSCKQGFYTLSKSDSDFKVYHVIKYFQSEFQRGYKLKVGDIIKFGELEFLVKDICGNQNESNIPDMKKFNDQNEYCKICHENTNEKSNPLISPCKCLGSIKFVHAECIKEWYKSKTVVSKQKNISIYKIKDIRCELCKTQIPLTSTVLGTTINLLEIEKPKTKPYIILESLSTSAKSFYLIHVDTNYGLTITLVFLT